jgi:hypothetical protein
MVAAIIACCALLMPQPGVHEGSKASATLK